MVGVVTAVLAGSAAGLIAVAAGHSAVVGFVTGGVVALATVVALMRVQDSAWRQTRQHPYFDCQRGSVPQAGRERHGRRLSLAAPANRRHSPAAAGVTGRRDDTRHAAPAATSQDHVAWRRAQACHDMPGELHQATDTVPCGGRAAG